MDSCDRTGRSNICGGINDNVLAQSAISFTSETAS